MSRARRLLVATGFLLALVLVGCAAPATVVPESERASGGRTSYPLTVSNCGEEVRFTGPPQRVVLLETAPLSILDGIGVLDRIVARAGVFSNEYYDPQLQRRLDGIEMLSDDIDAAGHLMISAEVVLAQTPDLALGLPEGLAREGLREGGANTLIDPVFCPTGVGDASFEALYEHVLSYGRIFDRTQEAMRLVDALQRRVEAVMDAAVDARPRTAAVLYPTIGGGPVYAYGRASMAQPQLEAAGFTNVFDDSPERVFEVSVEELIERNPDVLILLHQGADTGVLDAVRSLPGSDALRALENDDVLVQLFNFTEPPSPLSVTGLERIVERFGGGS
jgi:iron complex transport system substrate-binding protein